MNGSWRPSLAIGSKDSFSAGRVNLSWDNAVGFQWAEQDYWGRYPKENIDTNGGNIITSFEQHHSLVKKYYFFFRTSVDVHLSKRFYISPILHVDYRFYTRIPKSTTELNRFGVYDSRKDALTYHKNFNYKIGVKLGYRVSPRLDLNISYLQGVNESIYVESGHPWRNVQREICLNYKL